MADTRSKLVVRAQTLPADESIVVHQYADGWTVRELALYSDLVREGELMSNCLTRTSDMRHEIWDYYNVDDGGEPLEPDDERYIPLEDLDRDTIPDEHRFLSLRDQDNIPRLTFEILESDMCHVLGRHNSDPKWEYVERLQTWLDQSPDIEIERYYDYSEASSNPWPPTPIADWFQHHYDFAFKVGKFSYQARGEETEPSAELQAQVAAAAQWWAEIIEADPRADEDQLEWFTASLTKSLTAHLMREPGDEIRLTPGRPPGDHLGRALLDAGLGGLRHTLNGNQMLLTVDRCAVKTDFDRDSPFMSLESPAAAPVLSPLDAGARPQSPATAMAGIEI